MSLEMNLECDWIDLYLTISSRAYATRGMPVVKNSVLSNRDQSFRSPTALSELFTAHIQTFPNQGVMNVKRQVT